MQKTVYKCDQCTKEIGDKKHISLRFSNNSGIAIPPNTLDKTSVPSLPKDKGGVGRFSGFDPLEIQGVWKIKHNLQSKFTHFCNAQCLQRYFSNLIKKS